MRENWKKVNSGRRTEKKVKYKVTKEKLVKIKQQLHLKDKYFVLLS